MTSTEKGKTGNAVHLLTIDFYPPPPPMRTKYIKKITLLTRNEPVLTIILIYCHIEKQTTKMWDSKINYFHRTRFLPSEFGETKTILIRSKRTKFKIGSYSPLFYWIFEIILFITEILITVFIFTDAGGLVYS